MGRRGIQPTDTRKWVFNRLADDYRWRPPYPERLIARLVELAGGRNAEIVDVGAGTGLLAVPIGALGPSVTAVEPAAGMLDRLRQSASLLPDGRIRTVHAAAEATGLPSNAFDLWLAADALQWMDPELAGREANRLLRATGRIAVVEVVWGETETMRKLLSLVVGFNPRAKVDLASRRDSFFAQVDCLGPTAESFDDERLLDEAALIGMLQSISYVGPALGPRKLEQLQQKARSFFDHGATVKWTRKIRLLVAERDRQNRRLQGT